jgi:hypothetical protein
MICDATQMLFQAANMGRVQLEDMSHWNYSGTTSFCLVYFRNQFKTHQEYLDFGMLL